MLLKKLLEADYEPVCASDAEEALELVSDESFDLVLVDINLGDGKSGTELLHILWDQELTADLPAIALTSYAMPGDREELLDEGFDAYVSKPFVKAELTDAIAQALGVTCESG